ncbi:hypothetical protein G6F59_018651 [Rhizopus arrhizus]|nr:hypothetical protein G6F59_018651 [Rhizopus arrhizus]
MRASPACCWPTTTAATVVPSPHCAKWPSPRAWAWTSPSMPGAMIRSAACSMKNWAQWCRSRARTAPRSPIWSSATH